MVIPSNSDSNGESAQGLYTPKQAISLAPPSEWTELIHIPKIR